MIDNPLLMYAQANAVRELAKNDRAPQDTSPEFSPKDESDKRSLHIYLPGILGTEKGMAPIYNQVEDEIKAHFPDAEFVGKTSIISADFLRRPDGDRYVLLSRQVAETLRQGREVHLYAHSLGSAELVQVLDRLKKLVPELWKYGVGVEKLHIVLMAPAGFGKSIIDVGRTLKRLIPITFAGSPLSGDVYGMETLAYLPLKKRHSPREEMNAVNPAEQAQIMANNFPELSLFDEQETDETASTTGSLNEVYQTPSQEKMQLRFDALSEEEKRRLEGIDNAIHFYVERNLPGDQLRIKELMKQRGDLLAPYTARVYGGEYGDPQFESTADFESTERSLGLYAQALLGMVRVIGHVMSDKPYRVLHAWRKRGVRIDFLVPEFDVLVKMEQIDGFLEFEEDDERRAEQVVKLETTTHGSSALAPEVLAAGVRQLFAQKLSALRPK